MEDHDHPFFITRYMVKKYQGLLENQYECNYIYIYIYMLQNVVLLMLKY
jgi:hypothetical protein